LSNHLISLLLDWFTYDRNIPFQSISVSIIDEHSHFW